jgi:hypothetical protein
VFVIRGTKKFLDRAGHPVTDPHESTTVLGEWYANVLFWRSQVALFVNARTFLPVLMPMAPASSVVRRFPTAFADVVNALDVDPRFVASEIEAMGEAVLSKTASRQVLGVMNEFTFMAEHSFSTGRNNPGDLLGLSCWLADTIVGPLTKGDGYTPLGALQRLVAVAIPGA